MTDDATYVKALAILSKGSVRRSFNPYVDIDWESPDFVVTDEDERWILPESDMVGSHPWYREQPTSIQIRIGMWHCANAFKTALHFESILIRGLMNYTFMVPNGSPEHRYCLHEMIEEGNHNLMFQELVDRIGLDAPGMPRWLRWVSPFLPLSAIPCPNVFFFGVLAGENPFDYVHRTLMREEGIRHPLVGRIAALHVAEEARHISFGHKYLRKHVPHLWWWQRFILSLYIPVVMAVLGRAAVLPSKAMWREFGTPRKVRRQVLRGAKARELMREMFSEVRTLCYETKVMNPVARILWRLLRIYGEEAKSSAARRAADGPDS